MAGVVFGENLRTVIPCLHHDLLKDFLNLLSLFNEDDDDDDDAYLKNNIHQRNKIS